MNAIFEKTDPRRPYRVDKDTRGEFWAIWTAKDEKPGSMNNYVITDGIQHESEARSLCLALNTIDEITEERNKLLGIVARLTAQRDALIVGRDAAIVKCNGLLSVCERTCAALREACHLWKIN